jgi:acyl carrier protein
MDTTKHQPDPVLSDVIEIIQRSLKTRDGLVEIKPHMSLIDDLDLDSLTMVEVFLDLEDRFLIKITEADIESALTVGDIQALVSCRQNEN